MESIKEHSCSAAQISRASKALLAYTVMILTATMLLTSAKAQTFSEWFSQKKTQKKYLLQQIAALQVYSGYLRQGYSIAHNGLGSITGSLKQELDLHSTYYNKLKTVNPAVKDNRQAKEILTWQRDILTEIARLNGVLWLSNGQQAYINNVKAALIQDCNQRMTDLQNLLTSGKLEMSDDQRLTQQEKIHTAMQDNYRFSCAFTGQVKLYIMQRRKEAVDLETSKKIMGIR
jgi:hypothetical protein